MSSSLGKTWDINQQGAAGLEGPPTQPKSTFPRVRIGFFFCPAKGEGALRSALTRVLDAGKHQPYCDFRRAHGGPRYGGSIAASGVRGLSNYVIQLNAVYFRFSPIHFVRHNVQGWRVGSVLEIDAEVFADYIKHRKTLISPVPW